MKSCVAQAARSAWRLAIPVDGVARGVRHIFCGLA
jgi:hypothetical protein